MSHLVGNLSGTYGIDIPRASDYWQKKSSKQVFLCNGHICIMAIASARTKNLGSKEWVKKFNITTEKHRIRIGGMVSKGTEILVTRS